MERCRLITCATFGCYSECLWENEALFYCFEKEKKAAEEEEQKWNGFIT